MHVSGQLVEGVELMVLGMGAVFIFLTVLVVLMNGVSRLTRTLSIQQTEMHRSSPMAIPRSKTEGEEIIAVISAAINRYRTK